MGTDRVSSSSSISELVRALGVSRGAPTGKQGKPGAATPEAQAGQPHDMAALRQRLTGLLAAVDPDDEAALSRVRRPLLQEIILWEFGADFRQHPEYSGMLDSIDRTLDVDVRAHERLVRLIRHLQK